jgi:hypothetical protein
MSQLNNNKANQNPTQGNSKTIEWAGFLNEFLWICAGANRKILRQCPTDYAKYAGTGGTILFTAIIAAISGGYAISFVFQGASLLVPIGFGLIWGLMIFNLDRFMVNTMYSDGKHTISKAEFWGGFPRIILAIFLGVVISTPLEIRVFQDKINFQVMIDQGKVGEDVRIAHDYLYKQRKDLEDQITTKSNALTELHAGHLGGVSSRVANKEKELREAEILLYNETNGTGVTKKKGYGPAAKQLENQVNRLKSDLNSLRQEELQNNINNKEFIKQQENSVQREINECNRKLKDVDAKIEEKEEEGRKEQEALTGFCAQIKALGEISSPDNDTSLFLARLFISLLFIAIEVIPTLFKMMVAAGPYDDMLRAEKYRVRALADKKIKEVDDFVTNELKISTEKNKAKLEAELKANEEILKKLASAQSELIELAIEEWRKQELEKVKNNPYTYINSTTPSAL